MHNQLDAGGHRWHDECGGHVLAGQQRQGAHLISASRAEFARSAHMPDKAAIERDQQIEEKN